MIQLAGSFNAGYKQPIVGQQIGQESVCMQLRAKKERESGRVGRVRWLWLWLWWPWLLEAPLISMSWGPEEGGEEASMFQLAN